MAIKTGDPIRAADINNLTFFPVGTILSFSSAAWSATSAEFKDIWKICNADNHAANSMVPDLTNKFLRGGASSGNGWDNPTTTNTQTIPVPLPQHNHNHTHTPHSNHYGETGSTDDVSPGSGHPASGVFRHGGWTPHSSGDHQGQWWILDAGHDHNHDWDATPAGEANAAITVNTMPSYYTVIYIMKVS